jgi:putative addiction module CopG family antidote
MTITLQPEQEQMITDALQSGAYQTPDEVIKRALEMLHSEEDWLRQNRQSIDAKIRRGIEQLDRGEGISEEELDLYLAPLKKPSE